MPFISITRLRIRSVRFLPALRCTRCERCARQKRRRLSRRALLPDRSWTFWTMTAWDTAESMRRYMTAGDHKAAMPRLLDWCDEASAVHWEQAQPELPSWTEADRKMRSRTRLQSTQSEPATRKLDLSGAASYAKPAYSPVKRMNSLCSAKPLSRAAPRCSVSDQLSQSPSRTRRPAGPRYHA